ncbi:MAG: type IV secretory system conjugative DNA transfer family protein, partial [Planctomycetaceae bacterium]|nr:type IV secretory system conjugative DNA transfer family protein [Planctomycetaceae bacterium]
MSATTTTVPPGVDGLLLGYCSERQPFGLASRRDDASELRPIVYPGDQHLACISPTGGGKNRGLVIPLLLTYPGPVVVFDAKCGENYAVTGRRRRDLGQTVINLDPFRVRGPRSDSLNPLDLFGLPGIDLETECQWLAHLLSLGNRFSKDPFWDLNGCGLLSGLLTHIASAPTIEERHFRAFLQILMGDDLAYALATLLDSSGKSLNQLARWELAAFLQLSERETRPGVMATATSYVKPFLSETVLSTLTKSTFSLQKFADGDPFSIYLTMPPYRLDSHRGLVKLWVGVLLRALLSRQRLPQRNTLVILDECGQIKDFPFLETMLTLCRGFGVTVLTIWQDLDQLRSAIPSGYQTVLNNIGVLQVFSPTNYQAAEEWAAMLGVSPRDLMNL